MRTALDLSTALRALGVKGAEGLLDLLGVVQPVLLIGDVSRLSPPILPPTSWIGGQTFGTVLNVPIMQFRSLAKGGAWCRINVDTQSNGNNIRFNVTDNPVVVPAPVTMVNLRAAHQPSLVVGIKGSIVKAVADAAFNDDEHPNLRGDSFGRAAPIAAQPVYVPSRQTLEIAAEDLGTLSVLVVSTLWEDVPSSPPADALTASLP